MNQQEATWQHCYQSWKNHENLNPELAMELETLSQEELEDSFYRELEFGTGGLRGRLGVGTNRMNIYTVARATQGLATYLLQSIELPRCAIAYDSRNKSELFARLTAMVLAQQGVEVYLYPRLMPTPMLSFAVRHLGCHGGVVITASHNPAIYNGYKVYGPDGCQITLEAAERILACIQEVNYFTAAAAESPFAPDEHIHWIDQAVVEAYYQAVLVARITQGPTPISVAYSPLHGAGLEPVCQVLGRMEGVQLSIEPQQEQPDGGFPTCPYPNPEEQQAMALVAQLAVQIQADLCLATDPDCDRIGAGVPTPDGVQLLSGNEMGTLLLDFICRNRIANGSMPQQPVAVKTIVTTQMAAAVAQKYGVELREVLTGFKFIGEQIGLLEAQNQQHRYIFGFEESYGYLSGGFVRDKDAVNAAVLICEMAAEYKARGMTLLDAIEALYREHGYFANGLRTFAYEGPTGMSQMNDVLDGLRSQPPCTLAGKEVVRLVDYLQTDTGLPRSNVLLLCLEGGWQLILRPSGTEPKLKLYLSVVGASRSESVQALEQLDAASRRMLAQA